MKKIAMVFAAAFTATILAAAPAALGQTTSTSGTATHARAGQYPTKYKCDDQADVCVRLTGRKPNRFHVTYPGQVQNNTNRTVHRTCTAKDSKTVTWTLGASLSAELKAGVFASVNATISGSVSKSMTTEVETSVEFDVPPHTTTNCYLGVVVYRWTAQKYSRVEQYVSNFTVSAPRQIAWRIRDVN